MKTELFISWRYLFTKRKEKFISLISIISVSGVAIGVAALIVVIAVMSGFDRDLRDKIVGNYSHITISAEEGITREEYPALLKKISANAHVRGVSPYVQGQILVKEGSRFLAVGLRGIEPESESSVTRLSRYMVRGKVKNLKSETNGIIIGRELAIYLGASPESELVVYSPFGKEYRLKVVGIFNSGMYDYDLNLVFSGIQTAQELLGMNNKFSAVAVKLDNLYLAHKVERELNSRLGFRYDLKTWMEANQNFFAALKLEKLTMFIILTLIILVASFNIISTLVVMVVEKTKDIGILKAIGMSPARVKKIFTYQGLIIGALGTFLGGLSGVILCALLKRYQFIRLPQDIYYIDRLPVAIEFWPDIFLVILASLAITLVSTIYPAAKAAKLETVEALRYE